MAGDRHEARTSGKACETDERGVTKETVQNRCVDGAVHQSPRLELATAMGLSSGERRSSRGSGRSGLLQ
jgi:hypothetical protein